MEKEASVFGKAFSATLPVMAAYIVIGMGFGMLARSCGLDVVWAPVMSLFIYAGAAQYVLAGLFLEGASYLTIAFTILFVNIRYMFYGFSMIEKFRGTGAKKPYLVFSLTDETYSLLAGELPGGTEEKKKAFCFWVSVLDHLYWILGSFMGAVAGTVLHFDTKGIEFSLTALFITIFINHWQTGHMHAASLAGILITLISLLVFGPDSFLLPAMLVIVGILFLLRGRLEVKHG